jgi:hypothetical protein
MRQDHPVFNLGSQAEADAIVAWVARKLRDPNYCPTGAARRAVAALLQGTAAYGASRSLPDDLAKVP